MNIETLEREDYAGCNKNLVFEDRDFTQRYLYQLRGSYGPCPAMPVMVKGIDIKPCIKSHRERQMDKARNKANSKK